MAVAETAMEVKETAMEVVEKERAVEATVAAGTAGMMGLVVTEVGETEAVAKGAEVMVVVVRV